MYQKKAFNRREQDYAMGLRRKLEEAEAMLQHLAPSRARSLALTKLDEALLWANVGIAEAGLQQGYTAVPRNRGFDFDDALATNVDGQQVRATRAGDITFDGMKIVPRRDENQAVTAQNAAPSAGGDLVLLKPGQVAIDAGRLAKLVEESAQKEAAMGKDGASHHLAELELLARAQKDWYYAMMSYIMCGDSDAEESAQKEAAMGKDGASHHLAELELLARAQKDWYYAMMSYIMCGDSDAEEESK